TGSVKSINQTLATLSYQGNLNYAGPDTLTIVTNDAGNTGTGGPLTDTDMVAITVTPVDDPPVLVLPPIPSTAEDTALVFSTGTGNAITIADPDAGSGSLTLTLTVTDGT